MATEYLDESVVSRAGRLDQLDYKTLRHPGHWRWVREQVAALPESARMLLSGELSGVVLQSRIDPDRWLAGPFVRRAYYGEA